MIAEVMTPKPIYRDIEYLKQQIKEPILDLGSLFILNQHNSNCVTTKHMAVKLLFTNKKLVLFKKEKK